MANLSGVTSLRVTFARRANMSIAIAVVLGLFVMSIPLVYGGVTICCGVL